MKTFLRVACVGLFILAASSTSWAQGMNVALLDVGYIFKEHPGFKAKMEAMKNEVQQFEAGLKQEQQRIQAMGKQIATFKTGSPAYKRIEEDTTKAVADLKVKTQLKRKDIMEQEAAIYMATYKQVFRVVEGYATKYNIDLVLRYDRKADSSSTVDPRETLKIINRPVIYNKNLDISDDILKQFGAVATRPRKAPR